MGANITGVGTDTIKVVGVEELHDGDEIFTMSIINMDINEKIKFNKIKIARIFKSGINNPVIDITVKDTHTYISANGIVNHNSGTNF